jgi:hypothetical protein
MKYFEVLIISEIVAKHNYISTSIYFIKLNPINNNGLIMYC